LRFRALRKGDFVACRLSSRDLWILGHVVAEYSNPPQREKLQPLEFLRLSQNRRDQLFKDRKVMIRDVEDELFDVG